MSNTQSNKFFFVIESKENNTVRHLDVDDMDVIQNADGEVDVPLDRVLRKHKLGMKDLFEMKVEQINFVLESNARQTILNSISFKNLIIEP